MNFQIKQHGHGVSFTVKVVPGSSRNGVAGFLGNALKVNIAAPPEKGRANHRLLKLLAQVLDLPKSQVSIGAGEHQTIKEIYVTGITENQLREKLGTCLKK